MAVPPNETTVTSLSDASKPVRWLVVATFFALILLGFFFGAYLAERTVPAGADSVVKETPSPATVIIPQPPTKPNEVPTEQAPVTAAEPLPFATSTLRVE